MHEALGSSPPLSKAGEVVQTCSSSTWEAKAGESEVQGHFLLVSIFEASLGYLRPCQRWKKECQRSCLHLYLYCLGILCVPDFMLGSGKTTKH